MLFENKTKDTWKEVYLSWKGASLTEKQLLLLTEGPKCLTDAWHLGAMHNEYKKNFLGESK
jgi:hypothetical protein